MHVVTESKGHIIVSPPREPSGRAGLGDEPSDVASVADLRYNYDQIAPEHREAMQAAALDIRRRLKRTVEDMIEIGRQLNAVKELLPHGQFEMWLQEEFGMGPRIAQEYRNAADRFGFKSELNSHLGALSPTIVRRLAAPSVPEEAVAAVLVAAEAREEQREAPLRVRDAMAIVKPYLPLREVKPKQPPPPAPEPEAQVIEAEYEVLELDADFVQLTLPRTLVERLRLAIAGGKRLRDVCEPSELDRLFIACHRALEGRDT